MWEQLQAQFNEQKNLAQAAILAGDYTKSAEHTAKMTAIKSAMDNAVEISKMEAAVKSVTPQRPELNASLGAGAVITNPEPAGVAIKSETELNHEAAVKSVYVSRGGGLDAQAESILKDLHGNDYVQKYFDHKKAFSKYLRRGERAMDRQEESLVKQVVFNQAAVKAALAQNVDDIQAYKAAVIEAADTLGGYATLPIDMQSRILAKEAGFTVMRGRATTVQTNANSVGYIRVTNPAAEGTSDADQFTSSVRVTYVDELPSYTSISGAGPAETLLNFGEVQIPVETQMASMPFSKNMLEDAALNVEMLFADKVAEAIAITDDNDFLVGSGIKRPQGVLPNSVNALSLREVKSSSASAITWNGLINVVAGLPAQYRPGAVWVMNRFTEALILQLANTAGNNYWNPFQYAGGEAYNPKNLLGYPVLLQEKMPPVAANAYPILFGNLGAYQIVDRVGMSLTRYDDSTLGKKNMVEFVMRRRLGGQLTEPWKLVAHKISA